MDSFLKKTFDFFRSCNGGKFAAECVYNDIVCLECFFILYLQKLRKILILKKFGNLMKKLFPEKKLSSF